MADAPVPCRSPFAIGECERPLFHEGEHSATVTPPEPMRLILDAAVKAKRSAERWRWFFIIATGAQVALYIHRLIEGVPQ